MADMFGAPVGIMARQQNDLVGLQAQRMMGEIAAQPTDIAYKQALTRDVTSQSVSRESAQAQEQMMAEWSFRFNAQEVQQAQQQLVEGKRASGSMATVDDLGADGKPKSQMDRMIKYADFLEANGAPVGVTAPVRMEITKGLQHEAAAAHNQAQSVQQKSLAAIAKTEQVGQLAGTAAESPQAYMSVLGDPAMAKLLPPLSGNFDQDRQHLLAIRDAAMKTKDRLELERKMANDKAAEILRKATEAKAVQAVATSKAREVDIKAHTANLLKNGGKGSPEASEARDSQTIARDQTSAMQFRKAYPVAPVDSELWEPETLYSNGDGTKVAKYLGNGQWLPVTVPIPRAFRKAN